MKRVGLFGGSFNPIHTGHLILADEIRQARNLDEVWFMVSPLNPLKSNPEELVDDRLRFEMVELATLGVKGFEPCDIELKLTRPSYTVNTLHKLKEKFPDCSFSLIIGSDSFVNFNKWKNPDEIISMTENIYVYPRVGIDLPETLPDEFEFVNAPVIEISSTEIRKKIKSGKRVNFLVPDNVYDFIKKHHLYL